MVVRSQHFLFFAAVSDERYRRVMYYCAVAFSVELVNVAAAQVCISCASWLWSASWRDPLHPLPSLAYASASQLLFFGPRKLSVMGRLSNLFRNKSFILYGLASVGSVRTGALGYFRRQ